MNYAAQIRKWVQEGHVGKAIELLIKSAIGTEFYNEAIGLSSRFQGNRKRERKGVEDLQPILNEDNKITDSILALIDKIFPESNDEKPDFEKIIRIDLTVKGNFNDLTEERKKEILEYIRKLLNMGVDEIMFSFKGARGGSIILSFELPEDKVTQLENLSDTISSIIILSIERIFEKKGEIINFKKETWKIFLQKASLQGANLEDAKLRGANLQEASLQGVNFKRANLEDAILRGANLQEALLQGANFLLSNLKEAKLQGANVQGANFEWANLEGADMKGIDFQGTSLRRANLQKAILQGANLNTVSLYSANLQGAILNGASLKGASLKGAELQRASLINADLEGAGLFDTKFEGANLKQVNLKGAIAFDYQEKEFKELGVDTSVMIFIPTDGKTEKVFV